MPNKNVLNIAKFDFLNTLKSKGFIILNVVLCLLIVLAINLTSIIEVFKSSGIIKSSDYILEVYDVQGDVFEAISSTYDSNKIAQVKRLDKKAEYTFENISEKVIAVNVEQSSENAYDNVEVITKDTVSQDIYEYITNIITTVRNEAIELKYGITDKDAEMYKGDVVVTETILSNAKNQNTITQLITTAIGYLIFMLVMTITTTVASNIANEKTSKSAEYIFSTIPAKDYLNGKVLAANLKTIVTIVLIVFYVLLGLVVNSALFTTVSTGNMENIEITVTPEQVSSIGNPIIYIIMVLALIFITNTLISYIQAWLASRIKSISELDSAIMLPTVILVVAYFVSNMIFEAGNVAIYITSCIPILSMFILPTAYLLNKASLILLVISFAILIITLFVVYKFVTNSFKNNILDLGKKKEDKEQEEIDFIEIEKNKLEKTRLGKYITCVAFTLILSLVLGNIVGLIPMFFANEIVSTLMNILVFVIYIGLPTLVLSKMLGYTPGAVEHKEDKKQKITMYFVGLCGLIVAQIINVIFITVFNVPQSTALEQALQIPSSVIGILLFLVYIALVPAIFEEILFRKVMLNGAKRFGVAFAIIFTSVMFGLFHQNLQQILGTGLIGLVLAYVTVKTGDIKTSIALHFTNNLFAALLQVIVALPNSILALVFSAIELIIFILLIVGVITTIKLLITDREKFKIQNNNKIKIKISAIISNFYMIILLMMIISKVIVYLKI